VIRPVLANYHPAKLTSRETAVILFPSEAGQDAMIPSAKRSLNWAIIVLIGTSLVCWGWALSYYNTTPTISDLRSGRTHSLNNHGILHYLTDQEWHLHIWLQIAAVAVFFIAGFLDWFYDPTGMWQLRWEAKPPKRGETWPRPKLRPRRPPWGV
jgi:hypothetical protein